jgi:L-lactate dehydrogenase complex protein LldF
MNTCPVFRRSGGLSYGATYAGPIGVILDPTFNRRKYSALPFASTLNGSCSNVCPVKINIHEQIFGWRKIMAETHQLPAWKHTMMRLTGALLARGRLYRLLTGLAIRMMPLLPRFLVYNPANTWTWKREMPPAPKETFHAWWKANRAKNHVRKP